MIQHEGYMRGCQLQVEQWSVRGHIGVYIIQGMKLARSLGIKGSGWSAQKILGFN